MLGELISGRFRVEQRAGSGAMGTVYRATDEVSHLPVALKILHDGIPEGRARFTREVAALARMSHPGIVRYVAHGAGWVAMEWLDGDDLARRLHAGPLAVDEAIDLVARLADTLEYALRGGTQRWRSWRRQLAPSAMSTFCSAHARCCSTSRRPHPP